MIVTSDNPRSEDPEAIIERDPGRRRARTSSTRSTAATAIGEAIAGAQPGDVVVIAGKGHEQGQEFEGGRKIPFDDVTVRARRCGARSRDEAAERVSGDETWRCDRAERAVAAAPADEALEPERLARRRADPGRGPEPARAHDRLARGRARRAVRRPAGRATPTAAGSRRRRSPPAPGACSRPPSTPRTPPMAAPRPASCSRPTTRSAALQRLATAWRRELGANVIGVTGSTGKTSTKDLLRALLAPHRRTVASRANFNTEIGLPLEILDAPAGTEVLVLEMGMRGAGQIAELAAIAEPDVGVIVSIGPVHLELLGTIEAIAAAKAELIAALPPGGTAVVPAGEPLLEPHLRADVETVTFGAGGDVRCSTCDELRRRRQPRRDRPRGRSRSRSRCRSRRRTCSATCSPRSRPPSAVGVTPAGRVELDALARARPADARCPTA